MLKQILYITIFALSIVIPQSNSDLKLHNTPKSTLATLESDFNISVNNTLSVLQSPLHFNNNDLLLTGFIAALTVGSFSIDNKIRREIVNTKSKNLDRITYYGEKFGRPIYASILSGALYTTGLLINNDEIKETGQILAEAMICTGLFTVLLKETVGRARPFTGESYSDISLFEFEFSKSENSLPSGHTSLAFTVATVLSERLDNIYASLALYGMASLTAYQRIYSDVHWFSDILLGAALGTFIGLKIVNLHEVSHSSDKNFNIQITPKIQSDSYGVGFSFNF